MHRKQSLLIAEALVLALFLREGACDSICPNGITNITASSGSLIYPTSGNYGVNETKCWIIVVPDTYESIRFQYYSYDIETCKDWECDSFKISNTYNGLDQQPGKGCGRYSYNYLYEYLFFVDWSGGSIQNFPGSIAYIRFVSDDTEHYKGFNLTFIAGSSSEGRSNYLNASEDETITFGTPKVGAQNYPSNYKEQWFLIVPKGRQVQIDFDTFDLEDSKDCRNDYVEFREAYVTVGDPKTITGQYGPMLTGRLCGKTKPSSMQSKGSIVWVQFKSDSNSTTVYKGFKASFKAGQGRLSVGNPSMLLFVSALMMVASKNNLF